MSKPLDELYFVWLYSQVADPKVRPRSKKFWGLTRQLFQKEFVWIVPNDDNRIEDGKDLRCEFVDHEGLENVDPDWMQLGCSMLELLVGLSRRLAFETDAEPRVWFWELIINLDIYRSDIHPFPQKDIDEILERVIWRTYGPDGSGGLFPLHHPEEDQRRVELWYQLSAYLLENDLSGGG